MQYLREINDPCFSCGVTLLVGFPEDPGSYPLSTVRRKIYEDDVRMSNGHNNFYNNATRATRTSALTMVSLNHIQRPHWEDFLLSVGYVRGCGPLYNPNSGNNIFVYVRERPPFNDYVKVE